MNDYRRWNYDRRFEPSTTSMGKFFSNRLRDSLMIGGALPSKTVIEENFDRTIADDEATPEPTSFNQIDLGRSNMTPTSTSSNNDSYFTSTAREIHKFSRRVELSSGYNILKERINTHHPTKLTTYGQRRTPLAQLNPLPTTTNTLVNPVDDSHQRRMSFTDTNRAKPTAYATHFNQDGTRRPFSSDSPLPNPIPVAGPTAPTSFYISSAPPAQNRNAYDSIEPIKIPVEHEDNSIADLSRELRAAAYPTTRKTSHQSPTRETSPSTSRYTGRNHNKRAPPRSLPKLFSNELITNVQNGKNSTISQHQSPRQFHEIERKASANEDRTQNVSTLLDQFFSDEPPLPPPTHLTSTVPVVKDISLPKHEFVAMNSERSHRDYLSPTSPMRTISMPAGCDDNSMVFVSKYARLAPIASSQTSPPTTMIEETNFSSNHSVINNPTVYEQTTDNIHDLSTFPDEQTIMNDYDHPDYESNVEEDNFSYVPLKQDMKSAEGVPLLELDELETNSDISESLLVPIIYAKELANEIDLLQKAYLLKQQSRSNPMSSDQERTQDNTSVPPPANMEPLNFEALDEECYISQQREDTPLPATPTLSPKITMMEISSPLPPPSPEQRQAQPQTQVLLIPTSPAATEIETPQLNPFQQAILAHNRLSPWYKLPTELWFKILPLVSNRDLHNFSYVCKRFYALAEDRACQHRIVFNRRLKIEQNWLDAIQRRKPISLSFVDCRQQDLERLQGSDDPSLSNVKWLEFFQSIGCSLVEFIMHGCYHEPLTPNTLLPIILETCLNLTSLQLRWNNITTTTLNHLASYQQLLHLQTLDLSGCQNLDDTMLINIFIRTESDFQLRKLVLSACGNLTWTSLETIAVCVPNLQHLDVSRCNSLKNLSHNQSSSCFTYWPQLEHIDLGHLLTLTDDDAMIIFDSCQNLKTIILNDCIQLTDRTIEKFNENLQMINVNNCTNFTTNQLSTLNQKCPNLEKLNVSLIKNVNDQCLIQWCAQPFQLLKTLVLDYCTDCTSMQIERVLARHEHLQELSLNGNIISANIDQKKLLDRYSRVKIVFQ